MTQYHVVRETPDNSGHFVATGEVLDAHSAEEAVAHVVAQSTKGGRFGVWVYEPVRAPDAPLQPARVGPAAPAAAAPGAAAPAAAPVAAAPVPPKPAA